MRKTIISTIIVSLALIAGAQASDRSYSSDRRSSHVERSAHDGRYHERNRTRDQRRSVACSAAQAEWMSHDALRTKLTSDGYQVLRLKPNRNGCIEAKVTQANGWATELYVDPATARIKYRK